MVLGQREFAASDKTEGIFPLQYSIGLKKDRKPNFVWTFLESGQP